MTRENKNPWTPDDEREHFPSVLEWWAIESFFKSIEDGKRWSLKSVFNEWINGSKEMGSIFNMTLFDENEDKHFTYCLRNNKNKLETANNKFDVRYGDCFIRGSYPNYEMYFKDKENKIELDIKYHSESLPHWIGQDVANGWLPMGVGFYRYGFIPKNQLSGTMKIKDKMFTVKGKGYLEHVWGDFLYDNPLLNISGLKKTIPVYSKFVKWWLDNHKIKIPNSIILATENNPFGYDWAWALFDNGWTIFYGNILFWLMKGPVMGTLIFSKDGKKYKEFCNIIFHYHKISYSKNYDFCYPTEFELTARDGKEQLHLKFKITSEPREYVSKFHKGKYWLGLVISEAPGTVEGHYSNGNEIIKLSGITKIESQRQISVIGHNSLTINFLKPPKGVGVSFDLDSHYLKKKMHARLQLAPHLKIKFSSRKIDTFKTK